MTLLLSLSAVAYGSRVGKCGIASNVGQCQADLSYLSSFGDASHINCMGYGGNADPCTLNINNDPEQGLGKDPSSCDSGVLILWDEPTTQGKNAQWAASTWGTYSARWSAQLRAKRSGGMLVTTPMFNNVDHMHEFFAACPSCSDRNSDQYIDVLMFNAWFGDWGQGADCAGEAQWIKNNAAAMRSSFGNRPFWLGNFGYLGPDATGQKELDSIWSSGIMYPWDSGIDAVYYFAAKDYGGGTPDGTNDLRKVVGDTTIGQELMKVCAGASPTPVPPTPVPPPPPTPDPSGAACSAHSACAHLAGNCCPTDTDVFLACCNEGLVGESNVSLVV